MLHRLEVRMATSEDRDGNEILSLLDPDEQLHARAEATDASLIVTNRRVAVAVNDRLAMAVPFGALRRVQFDIERSRPATLVLVPDNPADNPQVLAIPPSQYAEVGQAIVIIGERLMDTAPA
jgi:hypothetical protein